MKYLIFQTPWALLAHVWKRRFPVGKFRLVPASVGPSVFLVPPPLPQMNAAAVSVPLPHMRPCPRTGTQPRGSLQQRSLPRSGEWGCSWRRAHLARLTRGRPEPWHPPLLPHVPGPSPSPQSTLHVYCGNDKGVPHWTALSPGQVLLLRGGFQCWPLESQCEVSGFLMSL